MIEITGLRKAFGRLTVLDDLDLSMHTGRVTAVVGPNAAGKTTLIKTILGLTRADRGRILVAGEPAAADGAYRARIGYMPQIARFPENLTARHLLALLPTLRDRCGAVDLDLDLIGRFGLERELNKPLRTLSGGTRQKVNAVLAFMFAPPLMILDEPTAGLDPISSSVLKDKIALERSAGRTVVIASHIMSELEELADDVVVLLDGTARFAGSLAELMGRTRQSSLERAIAQVMIRAAA